MFFPRSLVVLGLVFSVGLAGGFAWRQGWIEFPPPQTGVLDEAGISPTATLDANAPLAGTDAEEVTVSHLDRFEGLSEPEPQSAPLPQARVVIQAGSVERSPTPQFFPTATIANAVVPAVATEGQVNDVRGAALREVAPVGEAGPEQAPQRGEPEAILAEHKELSRIYWREPERRAEIQQRVDETARLIFFAPQPHFVEPHVIQPGDRLEAVAAKHKLTWEYLSKLNHVDPKRIQAGRRLKLVRGPFSAVIELADYSLTVHLQGYYVKRYDVGIGKDGSTPLGKFPVLNKVVNPQYTDPTGKVLAGDDPNNPLGERWIDLGNSYGIHGTIDPDSIGRAASRGCIRLRDADIVEVNDFLVVGSEVAIR